MENSKIYATPMSSTIKLDKDEYGKNVDIKKYRGMIGSLLYLTASRPDIMFSVCLCARFQSCSKESHLVAVKRIFRYLLGTIDLGLRYPKFTSLDLVGYSDADFAGCKIDRKSTSGTCHFLGHSLVSWFSKKKNPVALSTAEAEYIASGSCCAQVLYMKQQLEDFKLKFDHIPIRCDNTSAINISKNPILHSQTKHIEIRHHFICDHVRKRDVELKFISTDFQWADIFNIFHLSRFSIPNSLNIFSRIARLTCLILHIWMSIPRKAWRKCDSQSASLAPIPSQISSIYSLLFSLAKHTFLLSTLHTLKANFFFLV
jgi:hypothetical protein